MRVLVTGGLGFIGHNVVSVLEGLGHEVAVVDNITTYGIIPRAELNRLIKDRLTKIKTRAWYQADIASSKDIDTVVKTFQPDVVIHLASFPRQKVVNSNPTAGSRAMSEGLLNLLEVSVAHNVKKFVYVSSSMVYGDFSQEAVLAGIDESAHCNPIGQYAILKLAGEMLVKDYGRKYNIDYTIVRPTAVYGPLDVVDRVVSKFMIAALNNEEIQVNGPDELLDFTHVADTATGIALAAVSDNTSKATYNISRGQAHTLLEAAELVVGIAGQGSIKINARDNNFPVRGQLSNSRAQADFGFSPTISIEKGFKEYYDWIKNTHHS